jgi:hypothetical protein
MPELLHKAKDELLILNAINYDDLNKPWEGRGLSAHRRIQSLSSKREEIVDDKRKVKELEKFENELLEEKARVFSAKMSASAVESDRKREKMKEELLKKVHLQQSENEEKRKKEIEEINKEKRVIIESRLVSLKLNAERRSLEIKHAEENFQHVKKNLPLELDTIKQRELEQERIKFSEEQLQRRKSIMKPVNLHDLRQHHTRLEAALKHRQIQEMIQKTNHPSRSYNPLDFIKNKNNPYFLKKKDYQDLHDKSMKYADTVQEKIEQRSPAKAIQTWNEGQHINNFGYFYKQEVNQRKEEKNRSFDPVAYLQESTSMGRLALERKGGNLSKDHSSMSLMNTEVEEAPKPKTYKEFLKFQVDASKVNDNTKSNKVLNYYERLERAKHFKEEAGFPAIPDKSPEKAEVDKITTECVKSRSPNVFRKYMSTLDYLEEQAAKKERQEKKLGYGKLPATKSPREVDSIDLLSMSIQSKLKVLKSNSPSKS